MLAGLLLLATLLRFAIHQPPLSTPLRLTAAINPNTATAHELASLPGIGPSRAAAIIAYRRSHPPFTTLQDLSKINGLGPETLRRLEPHLTFATR